MKFSFGILTLYKDNKQIQEVIDSIKALKIPEYEILLIGPKTDAFKDTIVFDETQKEGWITRKKNVLVDSAKYDNVVVMHDYYTFDKDWYKNFLEFGDEEEGRSQVVSMDVRDTVQGILPSLMRIFFGPERVVEFAPQGPEDIASAEQATDYVDFIFKRDNPGFKILHSAFKDALVRKVGIVKYWWDESVEVKAESFSLLDEQTMMFLTQDPNIEISAVREYPLPGMEEQNAAQGIMTPPPMMYDVEIKRRITSGKVKIEALPPEEFLIDRRAKSIDEATFVGHRTMKTVSDLVAMGYDYDEMVEVAGNGNDFDNNQEYQARNPFAVISTANNGDPSSKSVLYIEGYLKVDFDGDGIAEMRRICTVGTGNKVLRNEIVDDRCKD